MKSIKLYIIKALNRFAVLIFIGLLAGCVTAGTALKAGSVAFQIGSIVAEARAKPLDERVEIYANAYCDIRKNKPHLADSAAEELRKHLSDDLIALVRDRIKQGCGNDRTQ